MLAGKVTIVMTNKRRKEGKVNNEVGDSAKKQRRDCQTENEPLTNETKEPEKRVVLKRLFGRCCSIEDNIQRNTEQKPEEDDDIESIDENDDPLLDEVPENMDPEQLGFWLCAQETLRFLYSRGFTIENPMFLRLRSRLLQGIAEIAVA